jgi:hypothetical protein
MMNRAASIVLGGLIVNMQASCSDGQKDVSRARQTLIEDDPGVQMPRPPFDGRVDVACEYMNMVKIDRHASFSSIMTQVRFHLKLTLKKYCNRGDFNLRTDIASAGVLPGTSAASAARLIECRDMEMHFGRPPARS